MWKDLARQVFAALQEIHIERYDSLKANSKKQI